MSKTVGRFPELLQARCPALLPPLVEMAAKQQCMTPAEYIRRSIIERLKKDGVDVRAALHAA
jgi:hypothetical protein